jgi:hypothetical protein
MSNPSKAVTLQTIFAEYTNRRQAGFAPVLLVRMAREWAAPLPQIEQAQLVNWIRDWEYAHGAKYPVKAEPPPSSTIRRISLPPSSQALQTPKPSDIETAMRRPYTGSGSAQFEAYSLLLLHVQGCNDPMIISIMESVTVGRTAPGAVLMPDVDLAEVAGDAKGIQPIHLSFRRQGETLVLADSHPNGGVWLNGQQMYSYEMRVLRDGDELRIGGLVCQLQFKNPIRRIGR